MALIRSRSFFVIVTIALFCSQAAQVFGADEPTDASDTGIRQNWNTPDCSGQIASTYDLFYDFSNTCNALTSTAGRYSCSRANFTQQSFVILPSSSSSPCTGPGLTYQETTAVGSCVNLGASSTMFWCNATLAAASTPTPVQEVDTSVPDLPLGACDPSAGCGSDRCTARVYTTSGCLNASTATFDPLNLVPYVGVRTYGDGSSHNPSLNTCYQTEMTTYSVPNVMSNIQTSLDGIGFVITESTGGCGSTANIQKTFTFPVRECFRIFATAQWATITCPGYTPTYVTGPSNAPSDGPLAPSPVLTPSSTPSTTPSLTPQGGIPTSDNAPSSASSMTPVLLVVLIAMVAHLL